MRHLELLALARARTRTAPTAFFSHLELNWNLFRFFQSALTVITRESNIGTCSGNHLTKIVRADVEEIIIGGST